MSVILLSVTAALAHKPSYSSGEYSSPESAFWVADPEVSIVLYHEVSCESPQLWMQLWLDPTQPLFLQLGVPEIARLTDYRPSVAVIGPGLPEIELPFAVPDGLGGILLETDDVEQPGSFYEPFSQTDSWILFEDTLELPEAGLGYIVAWDPEDTTGKLWVAVGTREEFGSDDFDSMAGWLDQTAAFHESGDYATANPPQEQVCASTDAAPAGCAVVTGTGSLVTLLIAGLLGVRRRDALDAVSELRRSGGSGE